MIGVDYRNTIFQRKRDDEEEDDDDEEEEPPPPPSRGLGRSKSASIDRTERPQLGKGGSFRGLPRIGSFRLEKKENSHSKGNGGDGSSSKGSSDHHFHKGGLRNFLEKTSSFRRGKDSKKSQSNNDNEDEESVSEFSVSSNASSFTWGNNSFSWGNTSISNDLALSVASFGSSSTFQPGPKLETEARVKKLLNQIQDRIDSRREKASGYKDRSYSCLKLACARYEAGSPNATSLVSMRRVHRLRHGLHRVNVIVEKLKSLHDEIDRELEEARLMADGPVLVDIDLEVYRTKARTIEEDANEIPEPIVCEDELLDELVSAIPRMQRHLRRRANRGTTTSLRRSANPTPTHRIKPV